MTTYSFVSTAQARPKSQDSVKYELTLRQQPVQARVCTAKERERRPVDPPPIIQLQVKSDDPLAQNYLQNPYLFMCANLVHVEEDKPLSPANTGLLAGTTVSSLYRLKDSDNSEGGFFVFADLSIKLEGTYRLKFNLFELGLGSSTSVAPNMQQASHLTSIISQPFTVFSAKAFPGMLQSTFLSRSFGDQGVRIRIRKEHRIQMKTPAASTEKSHRFQTTSHESAQISSQQNFLHTQSGSAPARPMHTISGSIPRLDIRDGSSYIMRPDRHSSHAFHPYAQPAPPSNEPPRHLEPQSHNAQPHWLLSGQSAQVSPTNVPFEITGRGTNRNSSYVPSFQYSSTVPLNSGRRTSQNSSGSASNSTTSERHSTTGRANISEHSLATRRAMQEDHDFNTRTRQDTAYFQPLYDTKQPNYNPLSYHSPEKDPFYSMGGSTSSSSLFMQPHSARDVSNITSSAAGNNALRLPPLQMPHIDDPHRMPSQY